MLGILVQTLIEMQLVSRAGKQNLKNKTEFFSVVDSLKYHKYDLHKLISMIKCFQLH